MGVNAVPRRSVPIRSVLMVCTGNICRSPAAESVLRHHLGAAGLVDVEVDSAGTGDWHAGERTHANSRKVGHARGYLLDHRARMATSADARFDLILAMDAGHLNWLHRKFSDHGGLHLFRSFDPDEQARARTQGHGHIRDLDDPYGHPLPVYEAMYDIIERTAPGIVEHVRQSRA